MPPAPNRQARHTPDDSGEHAGRCFTDGELWRKRALIVTARAAALVGTFVPVTQANDAALVAATAVEASAGRAQGASRLSKVGSGVVRPAAPTAGIVSLRSVASAAPGGLPGPAAIASPP